MGQTATTSASKIDIPHTTWVDEAAKGDNQDGTDLRASVGSAGAEEVSLLSFTIADPETLGIPSNAILNKVHIVLRRYVGASGAATTNMYFLNSDFTENQANWYGPDDETNTTVLWEPAFAGDSESSVNPGLLRGLYIDSQTSTTDETVTFAISNSLVLKKSLTFGSTVNIGLWGEPSAGSTNDAYFQDDSYSHVSNDYQPQYYVTYELPTPTPPKISIAPNADGINGTVTVEEASDSPALAEYSLCWADNISGGSPKHTDNVTTTTDTGVKTFDTDQMSGTPMEHDDTTYYFRLFAEDSLNTDGNGGASNIVLAIRPEVASSGTAISPSSLTIGEETTLTVVAETISTHKYGGKFSSVLVNWDSGASDTAADYVEYKFADNTAPALTTASNLTITHKYHKNAGTGNSGTFAIKVKVKDPEGWVSDAHSVGNATITSSDPIAHINANKGKVMNAKFVDKNNMLTISAAQSRAVGSDREIQNYLFTCQAGNADTIVTMGAYDNNNEVFDTGSKRVALINNTGDDVTATRLKIFGLASFDNDGDPISDHHTDFAYYKYTSEFIKPPDTTLLVAMEGATAGAADTVGNFSYNYFKSIEGAVFTTVDAQDVSGDRYLLMAYTGDWTTKLSGVLLTEDITINTEFMLGVDNAEVFKAGDVIKIGTEYMKVVNSDTTNNKLYVCRGLEVGGGSASIGYLGNHESSVNVSVTATHSDNASISILDPFIINRDLRYRTKTDVTDRARRYRWGGFAAVKGNSSGNGLIATAYDGTGDGVGGIIRIAVSVAAGDGSSVSDATTDSCWYRNGFYEDDIISIEGTNANLGSTSARKYYKIAAMRDSSDSLESREYDDLFIYGSDVDDYITTTVPTENMDGNVVRVITNPTRTVAIYSPSVVPDEVVFEAFVYDETYSGTDTKYRNDTAFTTVTSTVPNVLDLLTATDYDADSSTNRLTSTDIAILSADKSRSGGLSATMPLGGDKYPINVIRNKIGLPTMSVSLRILSSTGLRRIRSLIEGDTYDYVFIDSNQIDSPSTKEVTYRMKLSDGSLKKAPEMGSDYLADLSFVIVGEDVS